MFKPIAASLLLLFSAPAVFAAQAGLPAPAFSVQDISGHTQSISEYKGKIVVLEWNNPDCPFVRKHYESGNMQALQQYAIGKGVVWLTVNSSARGKEGYVSASEAKAVIARVGGHENAYILDPEGTLGTLYGAKSTPHMFVIDSKGILVYEGAIDDKPTPDRDDITGARNYVKAAIDALLEGKGIEVSHTRAYGCSVKYKD